MATIQSDGEGPWPRSFEPLTSVTWSFLETLPFLWTLGRALAINAFAPKPVHATARRVVQAR
jgi:hypothetical protein